MAEHLVHITDMPQLEIVNKDLVIAVAAGGEHLGRLTISRGGVGWFAKNDKQERHLRWEDFDRLIQRTFGAT
jgi:hypothetical protein